MTHPTARLTGLTGALLAGALVLTGCSGDAGHEGVSGTSGPTAGSAAGAPTDPSGAAAEADVAFAQGMLPHHEQAVEMARLAADRAADPRVRDLAARIGAAQAPEIDTLSGWLAAWGADPGAMADGMDHGAMGHGGGAGGMMTDEDMAALAEASGAQFDRAFLEMMLAHHRGAVQMAETEVADGQDADAVALAEEVRAGQSAEIAEMEQLLAELGG